MILILFRMIFDQDDDDFDFVTLSYKEVYIMSQMGGNLLTVQSMEMMSYF